MKKICTLLSAMLGAASFASAQCAHDPTITPSTVIFCPGESDTLWTQAYDSYQWYRDGSPIGGATNQYYVASEPTDGGHNISVEATLNSCAEMSPQVFIDGWAFAGISVMTDGDPYTIDSMGIPQSCPGDTLYLILMQPWEVNIQWYNNSVPIPGATDDTLIVTQTGDYTVSAAPGVCPNYSNTSIPMYYHFYPVITPVISLQGTQLACTPSNAAGYQWYLNGSPVAGANASTYQPVSTGNYSVEITDGHGCRHQSAPFAWTVGIPENNGSVQLQLYPNPADDQLNIEGLSWHDPVNVIVRDVTGREVMRQMAAGRPTLTLQTGPLAPGVYFVEFVSIEGPVLATARFTRN